MTVSSCVYLSSKWSSYTDEGKNFHLPNTIPPLTTGSIRVSAQPSKWTASDIMETLLILLGHNFLAVCQFKLCFLISHTGFELLCPYWGIGPGALSCMCTNDQHKSDIKITDHMKPCAPYLRSRIIYTQFIAL